MIEAARNDRPPDAGAASGGNGQPRADDRRGQDEKRSTGFYVYLSKCPLATGRALLPATANNNGPVNWTPARIKTFGEFRAMAKCTVAPCKATARAEAFERPVRPAAAITGAQSINDESAGADSGDDGLQGLLAAIADEVRGRAAGVCASLSAEFAGRIAHARKTLPRDQVGAVVAALKQMKIAAVKAVREAGAAEIKGRQKAAQVFWQKRHLCQAIGKLKARELIITISQTLL